MGLDIGKYVLNHEIPTDYPVEKIAPYFDGPMATETQTTTPSGDAETSGNDSTKMAEEFKTSEVKKVTPTKTEMQTEEKTDKKELIYDLYGIVNHYGNMGFGHYTAYGMNHKNNKWYCFDDSSVSSEEPGSVCTPAAYVLFYRRRDWTLNY